MRGSLKQRSKGSWTIILDLGEVTDPVTGHTKRKQKCQTFRCTREQAEKKLTNLLKEVDEGTYIDASELTLGAWLREWLAASKKQFRPSTYTRYYGIIDKHLAPSAVGKMLLQKVRSTHLEAYYSAATVSAATLGIHQAILYPAFAKAKRDNLVAHNVAAGIDRPKNTRHKSDDAQRHCWTALEARRFVEAATAAGLQPAAFYALALDSGARKGELCGLTWSNLDLDAGKMSIVQQLLMPGPEPVFGPPKTGRPRTVSLGPDTVAALRVHRQHQRELKMANRTTYREFGLVFAKEPDDLQRLRNHKVAKLGDPLQANNLGQREYAQLIKAAGLRPIKFHGLRHTCATLLLQAGQPVHVVSERLGHAKVAMTFDIYAHVLPDMQREAANVLGNILFGKSS